jgi:hypothetical protein
MSSVTDRNDQSVMIWDNKAQRIGAKTIEHIFSHTADLNYVTFETKSTVVP